MSVPQPAATQPIGVTPEETDRLPALPGVYLMRGEDGKVLYVGKAANLRSRVQSYFTKAGDLRFNVRYLMRHVRTVETIITATEKEAFLLENTLIKSEQPRYNLRLRDDKTYVSVRVNLVHAWPRAVVARRRLEKPDGALYLGPYASAAMTRDTLRLLQRIFPIRSCPDSVLRNRTRPCLLHQIGRCCAPCVKPVDKAEYDELVQGTIMVLKGKTGEVLSRLKAKMEAHSAAMEYERAAATRDRIAAIEATAERQLVHRHDGDDRDAIVMERAGGHVGFAVFVYRGGLLVRSRPFVVRDVEREAADLMEEFIAQFYESEPPPPEILVDPFPAGAELLEGWLAERREGKCEIIAPQRGDKVRLIEMAHENCKLLLEQKMTGRKSLEETYAEIMDRLELETVPDPIECYDISTIQGFATVGSMVTFREGAPDKSRYRHYKIKTVEGTDDFASMREILMRRFKRAVEGNDPLPGLVLIDGGKGQLNVAVTVFEELGIAGVGLASIAKSRIKRRGAETFRLEERFFLPGRKNPVTFPSNSPALYLLQQARDEAHRFGITFHRDWRRRRNLRSSLEDLPGVGPGRAQTLLREMGSLKAMKEATEEQIAAVPGIPEKVAHTVFTYLHMEEDETDVGATEAAPADMDDDALGD